MTGDAPQPGETPRKESNPWTFSDPETAFWRGDADREPEGSVASGSARRGQRGPATTLTPPTFSDTETQYTGEAADALAAGRQDATSVLAEPAEKQETEPKRTGKTADPAKIDRDHLQLDAARFDPSSYATTTPESATKGEAVHAEETPTQAKRASGVHEGLSSPETGSGRPTAALERAPAPSRKEEAALPSRKEGAALPSRKEGAALPSRKEGAALPSREEEAAPKEGTSAEGSKRKPIPMPAKGPAAALPPSPAGVPPQAPTGHSRLSQAAQRPPSPLLETSTFWLTDEQRAERAATMPAEEIREKLTGPGSAGRRRPRSPRHPTAGLIALVALGLVAAFFAWVSAEPFWLAVGHGESGVATVAQCTGDGVTQRCTGQFQTSDGLYTSAKVTLLGVTPGQRNPGAISPARMVNPTSHHAYVGETGLLTQLRWLLGFLLVLLCGLGIAVLTGSRRLETARARRGALIMSMAGPLLLLAGFLYIAY